MCITYQVTAAAGPGDIVSSRDFVLVIKAGYKGDTYLRAGCSIDYPAKPETSNVVRAWNGPTGIHAPLGPRTTLSELVRDF